MRVPDDIVKCVGFLCVNSGEWLYGGTGFFVSVKSELHADALYGYFVTAKHCVLEAEKYGDLHIRLNQRNGRLLRVCIRSPWLYSDDPGVDLAILPFAPQPGVDAKHLDSSMVASDEILAQQGIGIGDDLIITGLLTKRYGETKNLPIVRFGNIAAMPAEPLFDKRTGAKYNGYLIEARSIGGLSGSPVFAHVGAGRHRGHNYPHSAILLGIIRGHWDHEEPSVDFAGKEKDVVNMGIAVAIPAQEIRKILFSEDMVNKRREIDRERAKTKNQITEDDAFSGKPFTKDEFEDALKKATRKIEPGK